VHDIGKNIVAAVLECVAQARVVDLGTMCPCERIIEAAIAENARIIGVSGLISPSLEEMAVLVRELARREMTIPVLVGGAATSAVHTAVRLAPLYPNGLVVHVSDASRSVPIVTALLDDDAASREAFAEEVRADQAELRKAHYAAAASRANRTMSLTEARTRAHHMGAPVPRAPAPRLPGVHVIDGYPLSRLAERIDWRMFFLLYGIRGTFPNGLYPRVFADERVGAQARRLHEEARAMLKEIVDGKLLTARGVFGLFASRSRGEDIDVYSDESRATRLCTFYGLRQQQESAGGEKGQCLALGDIADDHIGVFAASVGFGLEELRSKLGCDAQIMAQALAMRLAEAFAECLHEDIRRTYWGILDSDVHVRSVRPAFGYGHQPDHSEKVTAWKLLGVEERTGIKLTETYVMEPVTSCCGLLVCSARARYFTLGEIGTDQLNDYAARKGISVAKAEQLLASCLPPPQDAIDAELRSWSVL